MYRDASEIRAEIRCATGAEGKLERLDALLGEYLKFADEFAEVGARALRGWVAAADGPLGSGGWRWWAGPQGRAAVGALTDGVSRPRDG